MAARPMGAARCLRHRADHWGGWGRAPLANASHGIRTGLERCAVWMGAQRWVGSGTRDRPTSYASVCTRWRGARSDPTHRHLCRPQIATSTLVDDEDDIRVAGDHGLRQGIPMAPQEVSHHRSTADRQTSGCTDRSVGQESVCHPRRLTFRQGHPLPSATRTSLVARPGNTRQERGAHPEPLLAPSGSRVGGPSG